MFNAPLLSLPENLPVTSPMPMVSKNGVSNIKTNAARSRNAIFRSLSPMRKVFNIISLQRVVIREQLLLTNYLFSNPLKLYQLGAGTLPQDSAHEYQSNES